MLAGHFSTALVANQKSPKGSLLFFLIASQFQDLKGFKANRGIAIGTPVLLYFHHCFFKDELKW
jgi:hypothetical protein